MIIARNCLLVALGCIVGAICTPLVLRDEPPRMIKNHQINGLIERLKYLDIYMEANPSVERKYIGSISASRTLEEFYIVLVNDKNKGAHEEIARPVFLLITKDGKVTQQNAVDDEFKRAIRVLPPASNVEK